MDFRILLTWSKSMMVEWLGASFSTLEKVCDTFLSTSSMQVNGSCLCNVHFSDRRVAMNQLPK